MGDFNWLFFCLIQFDQPESTVNSMKRSMSSFLGTVNNVLNPVPDDSDQEAMVMRGNIPVVLSRCQVKFCMFCSLRVWGFFITSNCEEY